MNQAKTEDSVNKKQIVLFEQLITVNDPAMEEAATSEYTYLPEHLVMDNILPRLPLKSLARFKAVSKHWFSFISAPRFDEHRLKLAPPPPNFLLLDSIDFARRMFVLTYDNESRDVHCPELVNYLDEYILIDSCNGLVCILVMDLDVPALWNPLTTHFQLIPHPFRHDDGSTDSEEDERHPYAFMQACDFGHLSSTDDYKVLCMYLRHGGDNINEFDFRFYVFSLKDAEWTRLRHLEDLKYACSLLMGEGFYFDDSLYWPNEDGSALGVVRFDLSDHQMRQLPEKSWLRDYNRVRQLLNLRGDLSVCCSKSSREEWDLWVFQKKGIDRTWLKLYSIDTTNLSVLAFSHCGMFLALHSGRFKLLEISAPRNSDDLAKGVDYHGDNMESFALPYVESLVDCRIKKKPSSG